jgi:ubiquinone/menaquinone biosynthesis C-methylase UbiE
MDHSHVNRLFVADLLAAWSATSPEPLAGEVIDVGTGTALIPIELCGQAPDCRVVAIDLSTHMLNLARYNLEVHSCVSRVMLCHVDGKELPFEQDRFAVVMSNSIVHHIPEPRSVLREAVRVAAPGGLLFFRDLLRPPDEATLEQLVATYTAGESDHARQMFSDSLHAALTLDEIRALVGELGFAPESVQATSDRHWTWSARK